MLDQSSHLFSGCLLGVSAPWVHLQIKLNITVRSYAYIFSYFSAVFGHFLYIFACFFLGEGQCFQFKQPDHLSRAIVRLKTRCVTYSHELPNFYCSINISYLMECRAREMH